jgi:hypothetical protein
VQRAALGIVLLSSWLIGCGGGQPTPVGSAAATAPAVSSDVVDLQALVGRWQRADGGYLLEVRGVTADGTVDAAYFNPRPINVAVASATAFRGTATLLVELDDVNYRGSTYQLSYIADQDALEGTYYLAAQGATYQVAFVRAP